MTTESISNYKLHNVKEQWSMGILAKALEGPKEQLEKMNDTAKIAGLGDKLDIMA